MVKINAEFTAKIKKKNKTQSFQFFHLFYFYYIEYYHTIISASVL